MAMIFYGVEFCDGHAHYKEFEKQVVAVYKKWYKAQPKQHKVLEERVEKTRDKGIIVHQKWVTKGRPMIDYVEEAVVRDGAMEWLINQIKEKYAEVLQVEWFNYEDCGQLAIRCKEAVCIDCPDEAEEFDPKKLRAAGRQALDRASKELGINLGKPRWLLVNVSEE